MRFRMHKNPDSGKDLDICETAFSEWFPTKMKHSEILL